MPSAEAVRTAKHVAAVAAFVLARSIAAVYEGKQRELRELEDQKAAAAKAAKKAAEKKEAEKKKED